MLFNVGDLIIWKTTEEISYITGYWLDYGNIPYYELEIYSSQLKRYYKEYVGQERIKVLIEFGTIEHYPVRQKEIKHMKYNIGDVVLTISDERIPKKFRNKVGIILETGNRLNSNNPEDRYTYRILLCGMKDELRYGGGITWMTECSVGEVIYKNEQ